MSEVLDINVAEAMVSGGSSDKWVLIPRPIHGLSGQKKRKEWERIVRSGRWSLVHDKWETALEAARALSELGGIETVQITRVKREVILHKIFFDNGKQVER